MADKPGHWRFSYEDDSTVKYLWRLLRVARWCSYVGFGVCGMAVIAGTMRPVMGMVLAVALLMRAICIFLLGDAYAALFHEHSLPPGTGVFQHSSIFFGDRAVASAFKQRLVERGFHDHGDACAVYVDMFRYPRALLGERKLFEGGELVTPWWIVWVRRRLPLKVIHGDVCRAGIPQKWRCAYHENGFWASGTWSRCGVSEPACDYPKRGANR